MSAAHPSSTSPTAPSASNAAPGPPALDPASKRQLLTVLTSSVSIGKTEFHLADGLERYAASLRRCLCEEDRKLVIPTPNLKAILNPEEPC